MHQEKINEAQKAMEKTLEFLNKELKKMRSGKANAEMVSDVMVEYYGTKTPLKQLATISTPESQMIVVQPYDKNVMSEIEKAILVSKLDLNPKNEGNILRLSVPPLTEERRKEMVMIMNQKIEESRISIRGAREKSLERN